MGIAHQLNAEGDGKSDMYLPNENAGELPVSASHAYAKRALRLTSMDLNLTMLQKLESRRSITWVDIPLI